MSAGDDILARNTDLARNALERFRKEPIPHFVNGAALSDHEGIFDNICPQDETVLCEVMKGGAREVDAAARAADAAFSQWAGVPAKERKRILNNFADEIEKNAEEISLLESLDTGQPIRYMSKAALRGADNFRYFADRAPMAKDGECLPADNHLNYTMRQPIGPVGVITPWNTPFMLATWKIAPALAAGCTVVFKPAEWSPVTAYRLAEIGREAGLPDGVLNLVNGFGEVAGKAVTEHPLIKAIAFVGESHTGSLIQAQGAPSLKRVHFELGGKNPVIVFDDADLDKAVDAAVFMIFSLNGQRCTSSSRLLVQESVYDEFVKRVIAQAKTLRVGPPLDPDTEVGPLIHARHFEKVMSYMGKAETDGATIAAGGKRVGESGYYVEPTVFTDIDGSAAVAREEIFGPVLSVLRFKDEPDAVAQGNDTPYGLAGYLWTNDVGRAHRVAQSLDAGMIWVNSENVRHLPAPFGGMKASGVGRDGGDYSFDFYMETKNICVSLGRHKVSRIGTPAP